MNSVALGLARVVTETALGRQRKLVILAVLLSALFAPALISPFLLQIFVLAFLYAYLASSWNIIGGYAGQLSLAHGALFAVGAYTSALLYLRLGVTPWLGMLAGAAVASVLGCLIAVVSFRYRVRGTYFVLVTLAFAEFLRVFVLNSRELGGAVGFQLPLRDSWVDFQFQSNVPYYYIALALLLGVILISRRISQSRLGIYFVAIRESEEAAEALGVDAARYKTIAMLVSAALVGAGGAFYVQFFRFIQPELVFSLTYMIQMMLSAMVGGLGTVAGPVVGSFALTAFNQVIQLIPLGSRYVAATTQIVYGAAVLLIALRFPNGLADFRWLSGRRADFETPLATDQVAARTADPALEKGT